MSKKMMLIMLPVAGLLSFSLFFTLAWFTKSQSEPPLDSNTVQTLAQQQAELGMGAENLIADVQVPMERAMTERQLKELIRQVQDKISEYESRLSKLQKQEDRLAITQDGVKEDMQKLSDLRVEVAQVVADLKVQQEALEKTRIKIDDSERDNLKLLAATYTKMEAESAGRILTNMISTPMSSDPVLDRKVNLEDAVKILYYMKESTKAEILTALIDTEPELAGILTQRLKRVVEDL